MAGFASTTQDDFSKGAHVGHERVPATGVEDCINGLYDDDGTIFKRGGAAYLTTSDTSSTYGDLRAVWSGQLVTGEAVIALSSIATQVAGVFDWAIWQFNNSTNVLDKMYDADESLSNRPSWGRMVETGGVLAMPRRSQTRITAFGGADKALYTVGGGNTVTVTAGSTAVSGSGTTFATDVEAGMILAVGSPPRYGIVKSVTDNTNLVLDQPWAGSTATSGATFNPAVDLVTAGGGLITAIENTGANVPPLVCGTAYGRLLIAVGRRLYFSSTSDPFLFTTEDYHEFPDGVSITGLEPLGDAVLVFTTDGVSALSGLALDLTDDYGNTQHRLDLVNRDLILWDERGIAAVPDGALVPALDDVYAFSPGSASRIGGGIRRLYRQYVKAGYMLGHASVHRGHYFLPIIDPATDDEWVDLLVCNLDSKAWSRWDGYGGKVRSLTQRMRSGAPSLVACAGAGSSDSRRLTNLTGCFEPAAGNKQDADATTHNLKVTFRTLGSSTLKAMWARFRVLYTLTDAASDNPTMTAEYATGLPGSSFTALTGTATEADDGMAYWPIRKRTKTIRVRLTTSGASAKCVIRGVETLYRQTGRK